MIKHPALNPKSTLKIHPLHLDIIALTGVSECEIIENTIADITYRVAYVTGQRDFQPVSQTQLGHFKLDGIIKINHMPLKQNGERDVEVLKTIIPPIETFQNFIEDKVQKNTDVKDFTLVTVPINKKPPTLHLSSLLNTSHSEKDKRSKLVENQEFTPSINQSTSSTNKADALVSCLPLVDPAFNKTLPESLKNAAKNSDGKIIYLEGSKTDISNFSTLLNKARDIRDNLISLGLKAGDHALIHVEQPQEIIPAFWACILGGIIPTITPIPPTYHADASELAKLTGVWQLLGKPVIISTNCTKKDLEHSGIIENTIPKERCLTLENLLKSNNGIRHPDHIPDENDVAFFCLSSGSTGTPKCIQMTHKNVLVRSRGTNNICQNSKNDIILNWLPFDHIGSISDWHIRCIELGCQMVYCNKDIVLSNPLKWLDIINQYRVSHTWAPNFAYSAVNVALKKKNEEPHWDLSCIKIFLTAAETVSAETIHEFTSRLSQFGLNKDTIKPAFGMAEMGSGVTYNPPGEKCNIFTASRDSIRQNLQEVPSGSPSSVSFTCLGEVIPSMAMRIVSKKGKLMKEGVIGHLHMKGDCVSPGYYKNDSANAVFLKDGWMDTGDEGFILDQKLYLSGRTKDTIIIGGANYLPIEIEKTVEAIEGIAVSYVAATAVKPKSEKSESLAIFFSLSDENIDLLSIIKKIKESVAQKMGVSPNYLVCLSKQHIPKTAIGKIQRSKLTKQLEEGNFDSIISQTDILLENNRTIPDWFCEKSWIQYQRPIEYPSSVKSLVVFCYGEKSFDIARQIENISAGSSIKCTVFIFGKDIKNQEHDKDIQAIDLSHSTIVNLLFLEDFKEETSEQLLLSIQNLKRITDSNKENQPHAISLVTLDSKNLNSINRHSILYQSLATLFRSIFSASSILTTCVDFREENLLISSLFQELITPQDDQEIYLDQESRYISRIRSYRNLTQKSHTAEIKNQGLYVITGGLGGIGQEVSTWLLSNYNAKLIIIGRSTLSSINSNPKKKQALDSLNSLGDVFYIHSSLNDADTLNTSIKKIEISVGMKASGFFHLAGIVKEIPFSDDTLSSINSVLEAKAYSALNIHQLILQRPEAISVYFSSTLASIPSSIAPTYALANRMLDELAKKERQRGIKSYSIAWSAWKNTGMSANTNADALLAAQGLYALTPEQALNSLLLSLSREPSNIIIGANRFSSALNKLSYSHTQAENVLHLAYVSSQASQVIKYWQSTQKIISSIGSTQVDEIIKNKEGLVDTVKMTGIINGEEEFIEATTDIEIALSEIWCEILKIDRVSMNDNFFALGGHSLLAAELVSKINQELLTTLPISLVFEAATIAEQALLVDNTAVTDQAQIIPLQPQGEQRPLFCLCGIEIYQALADKLGPNIPVYGIFLPIEGKLFDTNNEEHIDVETMAKEYAEIIIQTQNQGPYRLAGISFGGILAYETAKQLKAAGNEVELLSMIDFVLPNQPLRKMIQAKKITIASVIELFDTTAANTKHYARSLLTFFKGEEKPKGSRALVQHEYKLAWQKYRKNMQTWSDSKSVVVFRSKDEPSRQGYSRENSCGWEQFMPETPESHIITGNHLGVLKEPNVDAMADVLKTHLLK